MRGKISTFIFSFTGFRTDSAPATAKFKKSFSKMTFFVCCIFDYSTYYANADILVSFVSPL